ncbi:uncharacterized protein LOC110096950 [Dendrobium catenatum]|uniref:Uncharacterized protein n=1 Tax=Dendrobium catenatum TaxID=906689 RepID=A0A2I0X4G0_9ASPA|nr:uncharacterized protein LOC110096950 [Dendrobium catenatum]PKU82781.1 hypothetical protein MA16_Dca006079 [Dendrobium catenatum]
MQRRPTMAFALHSPPSRPPLTLPFKSQKPISPLLNCSIAHLSLAGVPTTGHGSRPLVLTAVSPASEVADVEEKPENFPPTSSYKDPEGISNQDLENNVLLLKQAAKTRMVPAADVLSAISAIKKAKVDSSSFLETLGGSKSPGRTWMLIFTAQSRLDKGSYFPVTAVQRFDATAKRIENGIYLGPIGSLTFEGKFSWKKKMLAFMFEYLRIKVGSLGPFEISLGKQEREPTSKDPFFIWFYIDNEIAVAQGRGGGFAFWCRCRHVANS